jgi:DNA transposition AAA+ family ATPase
MTPNEASTAIPAPRSEHLPGLHDAATIDTPGLRLIRIGVQQLFSHGGIILIDGKPGVGKTFGTRHVVGGLDVPVHWVDMPDTPKGKEANARIYTAVTGRRPPPRATEYALTEDTVDVLDGLKTVLAIDEAQNMTVSCLRQIRFLHDRPSTKALLVLIGPGIVDVVRRVPELDSRVSRRVFVKELTGPQLKELLPEFHPMLASTTHDVLTELGHFAKGNLRNWARILEVAQSLHINANDGIPSEASKHIIRAITGGAP